MSLTSIPVYGAFSAPGRPTATGGTAFISVVPPAPGTSPPSTPGYGIPGGKGQQRGVPHVTKVIYTTGATAHTIAIMRPLNVVRFTAAGAAAQAVVTLGPVNAGASGDPGIYSTNYGYGAIPGGTSSVADHGIASGDYCVYQAADGSWVGDTAASTYTAGTGNTGAVTLTTNLPTGGVAIGGLFYYFGLVTLKDPATGQLGNTQTTIAASQTRDASWTDSTLGIASALHSGDPLLFYSPNGTNAGFVEALVGFYAGY